MKDNAEGDAAVKIAESYKGTSHADMPCSTLVVKSYPNKNLPEGTANQYKSDKFEEVNRQDIRKGDVLFFKRDKPGDETVSHEGIVKEVRDDGVIVFVHSSSSHGVTESDTNKIGGYGKSTWGQLTKGFRRPK